MGSRGARALLVVLVSACSTGADGAAADGAVTLGGGTTTVGSGSTGDGASGQDTLGAESTAAPASETTASSLDESDDGSGGSFGDSVGSTGEPEGTTSTTGEPSMGPDYVLSIDDQGVVARLLRIDTSTGVGSEQCLLPAGLNYNSLAFARDGVLFGHTVNEMAIDRIDPCTCDTVRIAEKLPGNMQLSSDAGTGLYALDLTNDVFLAVNPATGVLTTVGPLGVDFENSGVAWLDDVGVAVALDGLNDQLWTIDVDTGVAADPVGLSEFFGSVGLDFHPGHGLLYACSTEAMLATVDPATGVVDFIGEIGGAGCDNLAAPWEPIECLE